MKLRYCFCQNWKLSIMILGSTIRILKWVKSDGRIIFQFFFFNWNFLSKKIESLSKFLFRKALPSFCKREHLKMFSFAKIDIFVLRPCSRSGKIFKSLTRLVCELSIISINNFAKGNVFMSTITSQQLFFTIENLKVLYVAVIDADNPMFKAYSL